MYPQLIDKWDFSGDEEFNTTIGAVAAANQTSSYPGVYREGVVRLTSVDHGFKVSPGLYDTKRPNLIYVQGTTNYDGLRKIVAVATDTLDIVAKYVAETPGGSETLRPGFKFDHDVEFLGFDLHLAAAAATAENLVVAIDSDRGAAWDTTLYTLAMNTVQNATPRFIDSDVVGERVIVPARDIVYLTFANTNDNLWGLTLYTRRMS